MTRFASTSPGAEALRGWASAQPEAPFLFYRNARGQFRWWSFATVASFVASSTASEGSGWTAVGEPKRLPGGLPVEREAVHLLGDFLAGALAPPDAAVCPPLRAASSSSSRERDVWISWRPLSDPEERGLAQWAVIAGAAVLVEPSPALHPELVAWVRPTLLAATAGELSELADGLEALAPRWLRRRWFRQRGERLRRLLVGAAESPESCRRLEARWRALSPEMTPTVVPISPDALV